jgi:polyhydroxybutyrate depolymerase
MIRPLAALLAAFVAVACQSPAAPQAPGTAKLTDEKLQHGGLERRFLVHDYAGKRAPVVIILHGGGGNAENAVNMTQFDTLAAREHIIAVYPEGTGAGRAGRLFTWNAGHCCAYAMENKIDDVGFISALIDKMVADGRADPKRIYVTGMSNGGMMSHRLGRELSTKIAAIAPVVGAVFGDEPPPAGPMPAYIFVGQEDGTVPGAGGALGSGRNDRLVSQLVRPAADLPVKPDVAAADYWAKGNGCTGNPVEGFDKADKLVSIRWTKCNSGSEVWFERVPKSGHAWPGGRPGREGADVPNPDVSATNEMWAFFKRHTR